MAVIAARAAIAGASGYAGGELARLLLGHPAIEPSVLTAESKAGRDVTEVHPQLPALGGTTLLPTEPENLLGADIVFLALPHGESAAIAAALPPDVPVVDLGADHRLVEPASWTQYYGSPHAGWWPYGLPELPGARAALVGARRIANPGCYPTAVALGLVPLLAAGLVEASDIVVVAASGTSGAGRATKPNLLGSEVMGAVTAYKVGGTHQHTPEIEQSLSAAAGSPVTVAFTPTLAPMPRGILATSTARLTAGTDTDALRKTLTAAYDSEPFVHVLAEGTWPSTAATAGSNSVHVSVAADPHAGRAVVVTAMDNLVKGAAGQAVQNANLALGLDETSGLSSAGVAP